MAATHVYLIEAENGFVKIGFGVPWVRLCTVRTHSPVMVRLIAQWPGGLVEEQALHAEFLSSRNHCEWFRMEGEFLDFVRRVRGTGVAEIPEWSSLLHSSREQRRKKLNIQASASMKAVWADPKWKLHHLGQLLGSRMAKKEFGTLTAASKNAATHRRFLELQQEAHRLVRLSPIGLELLEKINSAENGGVDA